MCHTSSGRSSTKGPATRSRCTRTCGTELAARNCARSRSPSLSESYTEIYSATDEKFDQSEFDKLVKKEDQLVTRGIEVGHIFYFGDKYSKPMKAVVNSSSGTNTTVEMGSYGIGVSRLVGAIVEANYNDNIMKWPTSVAPFHVAIINLGKKKRQ